MSEQKLLAQGRCEHSSGRSGSACGSWGRLASLRILALILLSSYITVLGLIFFISLMEINSMYLRFSEIPRIFGVFSVGTLVNSEEKKALRLVPLSPGGGSRAD